MSDVLDKYAVVGYPIHHSLSPKIHTAFAEQTHQSMSYEAIELKPENFTRGIRTFFGAGGQGLNCTVPLKELAFNAVDRLSERAKFSGAVNTIKKMENGELYGDNTDGVGLLTDLTQHLGLTLKGKRVLVIGAGGAARGIIGPLMTANPGALWLVNRTMSKAEALQQLFKPMGELNVADFAALAGMQFDIIINATSASLSAELPPLPANLLVKEGVCYDLAYSKEPTAFMEWGVSEGAILSVDGLGMLVEQAAQAFYIWREVMPKTDDIRLELLNN